MNEKNVWEGEDAELLAEIHFFFGWGVVDFRPQAKLKGLCPSFQIFTENDAAGDYFLKSTQNWAKNQQKCQLILRFYLV